MSPRELRKDTTHVFRAVVTITYPALPDSPLEWMRVERTTTKIHGPYTQIGPARAAITLARRNSNYRASWYDNTPRPVVEAYVERTPLAWERVDDE